MSDDTLEKAISNNMLDRMSAYLAVRRALRQPQSRRRAQRAELLMERLAQRLEQDPELWATLGLFSHADLDYLAESRATPGRVAREIAQNEGMPVALAELLLSWRDDAETSATRPPMRRQIESALCVTFELSRRTSVGELNATSVATELRLAAESGSLEADRLYQAIEQLGFDYQSLAEWLVSLLQSSEEHPS